jgi:hypothetical protein
MFSFPDFFNHFFIKSRQVIRFAAGNQPLIRYYFLVYPGSAGIFEVSFY